MDINTLKGQTIIHATLRNEDLYPAFRSLLVLLDPEKAQGYPETFDDVPECATLDETWSLVDDLNALAPDGYYFGTHPGDASDFGFWKEDLCEED